MRTTMKALVQAGICACILTLIPVSAFPQQAPTAETPVLVTSCGQSPGPVSLTVFLKRLGIDHELKLDAGAQDLAGGKFKTLVIVTGASLKGMGAAGVSIKDEVARAAALIAEARKHNILVVGAHIEGMERRAQAAAPGDNSDELSIDAVCPNSQLLLVKQDGDSDGRFTKIAADKKIPMLMFEKNMEMGTVLKTLFAK
jgi:hypothetical protein